MTVNRLNVGKAKELVKRVKMLTYGESRNASGAATGHSWG